MTDRQTQPILSLRGISKSFGGVRALSDVSIDLTPGKVVALVGDNGAGKSTLVKTMSGVLRPDRGQYFFEGREVHPAGPAAVAEMGVQTVYQDLALCNNLDAVQNLFLGRELTGPWYSAGRIRRAEAERRARDVLRRLRLDGISLTRNVGAMSGGQRQNIAIARSILWEPKVVLLDEPTAALSHSAAAQVGDLVRELASHGLAVLVISHDIHHFVLDNTDVIEVLRLGRNAGRFDSKAVTGEQVVNAMVGGDAAVNAAG
ncbi:ATP-binding cassette domain-containing protein [Meridianimarinicoccus sp. RP-17]|uniref:ATP-binding cassette domain-containing protein n=1 Tax=Meridianimarinicoccus zhengii TaxID=2056810 RepID=UPI000DAE1D41|nr:ATP-binding cassette domain-containing protein [Phycocomes zhengii]